MDWIFRRFKVIDKNKDGRINLDEFRQALQIEGLLLEAVVETRCFEQIDTDHSGYINFDEFIYALRVSSLLKLKCSIYKWLKFPFIGL